MTLLLKPTTHLRAKSVEFIPRRVSYSSGEFGGPEAGMKLTLGEFAKRRPLSAKGEGTFGTTFLNGCHIAEVENEHAIHR